MWGLAVTLEGRLGRAHSATKSLTDTRCHSSACGPLSLFDPTLQLPCQKISHTTCGVRARAPQRHGPAISSQSHASHFMTRLSRALCVWDGLACFQTALSSLAVLVRASVLFVSCNVNIPKIAERDRCMKRRNFPRLGLSFSHQSVSLPPF